MATKKAPAKKPAKAAAAAKKSTVLPPKKTSAVKKMNKSELIRLLADKMALTTKQCATFFDILAETAIQ
jgi:DNA-binding protein HU-beta